MQIHVGESIAILFLIARVSFAQQHPATNCPFDGFSANPKLAETVGSSVTYYGCAVKSGCLSTKLQPAQLVVVFSQTADWICGYVAIWRGRGDVDHSGDLDGEAIASGNHLRYSEAADACTVELTLFGEYIVANDNDRCGG